MTSEIFKYGDHVTCRGLSMERRVINGFYEGGLHWFVVSDGDGFIVVRADNLSPLPTPVEWPETLEVWRTKNGSLECNEGVAKLLLSRVSRTYHRDGAAKSCPCYWTTPCSTNCSCANPVMSGGCERCCAYGNDEQRKNAAVRLASEPDRRAEKLAEAGIAVYCKDDMWFWNHVCGPGAGRDFATYPLALAAAWEYAVREGRVEA